MTFQDSLLELRIQWHRWRALSCHADRSKARTHWLLAFALAKQRSPQRIAEMEQRMGLDGR